MSTALLNFINKFEQLLELKENIRLLKIAESRRTDNVIPFEEFIKEEGFSMEELEKAAESVEFE